MENATVTITPIGLVAEFLGTFLLVVTTFVSGSNPLAVGGMIALIMYLLQNITKGIVNPAIIYAMALKGDITWATGGAYAAAVILGGLAGVTAYMWVAQERFFAE
jgi:glycerol uptake facilitator-like aquaporin